MHEQNVFVFFGPNGLGFECRHTFTCTLFFLDEERMPMSLKTLPEKTFVFTVSKKNFSRVALVSISCAKLNFFFLEVIILMYCVSFQAVVITQLLISVITPLLMGHNEWSQSAGVNADICVNCAGTPECKPCEISYDRNNVLCVICLL